MKKSSVLNKVRFLIILILIFTSIAWKNTRAQNARWTIMVYLDADNNLEDVAITDFNEMEAVGSTDSVNIIVQFDRIPSYDNSNGDWTDTRRFRVLQDANTSVISTVPLEIIGEKNMGDPQTLTDFMNWTVLNFPADNYALVLWNHGGGWRYINDGDKDKPKPENNPFTRDVCFDNTSNDYLSNYEVSEAISESMIKPDIVAFDACLMGMIEVAYQLRDLADIMVASEESIPWDGFDYEAFLNELVSDHNMTADTLSKVIVKTYGEYYELSAVTNAAVNLDKIRNIAGKLDTLIIKIINNGTAWDEVGEARTGTQRFDVIDYLDLWSLADMLKININDNQVKDAADSLKNAIDDAVIENYASDYYNHAKGLSIYFPLFEDYDPEYGDRLFSKDFPDSTMWITFLSEFYQNYKPDINEPNNHFANATIIDYPGNQTGLLNELSDIDIFKFYYNGTDDASIVLSPPANFDIYLYSVNDTLIQQTDSSKNTDTLSDTIIVTGLDPGIYYLAVKPAEAGEDYYGLDFGELSYNIGESTNLTQAYDDGNPQHQFYSNAADTGVGMKFTGEGEIQGVWYYITDIDVEEGGGDLGLLNLHIYEYYSMQELWDYEPVTVHPDKTGWNYIDISDQEIEFFFDAIIIGFTWDGDNTPAIGADSIFSDNNSFYYSDYSWELPADSVLFFIRPVYSLEAGEIEDTCYCNEYTHITDNAGQITDGSGEYDYANNSFCSWLITTEDPASIFLSFTEFNTEEGFDYVYVYDGGNSDAPLMGAYSGLPGNFVVSSPGGAIYIEFYSDESVTRSGWKAFYSVESNMCYCQEFTLLTDTAGTFSDGSEASDYGNNSNCIWLLQLPQNRCINLQFTEFNLENGNDSVIVYDGSSTTSAVLSRLTGTGHNDILTSSGNSAIIKFISDNKIVAGGWSCQYSSSVISNIETGILSGIDIFPNPGRGIINFSIPADNGSLMSIVIINSLGNIVETMSIQAGTEQITIDISGYPEGLYFIKITNGTSYVIKKYMIN